MAHYLVNRFRGIHPRQESASPGTDTPASVAENCTLFNGIVKPFKGNVFTEDGHAGPEFVGCKDNSGSIDWVSGLDKPVQWRFGEFDMIFHFDSGEWKKKIGNAEGSLGIKRPDPPILENISLPAPAPATVSETARDFHPEKKYLPYGTYSYTITFSKTIDGQEVESPPSDTINTSLYFQAKEVPETDPNAVLDPASGKYFDTTGSELRFHNISRPPITDPSIETWNVYRSDNGSIPRLISKNGSTGAGDTFDFFEDTIPSNANGRPLGEIANTTDEVFNLGYQITWERQIGPMLDESGPSNIVSFSSQNIGVKITRPIAVPTGVTHWNIYRISTNIDPTTEFQRVARVPISESNYEDFKLNRNLGAAIPTSFENPDGIQIDFDQPQVVFDAIGGPHYGMLFGWKGSTLYYSQPGNPDAWPVFYKVEAIAEIVNVLSAGAELLVLTTKGIQRGIGTDPVNFYLAQTVNGEGAITRKATVVSEAGIFYLSYAGIVHATGTNSKIFSDISLGREFFDTFDHTSSFMEYHEGTLYLFHSGGVLKFDTRDGKYSTLSDSYTASFVNRETGKIYVLDGTVIKVLGESADPLTVTYETGDIVLGEPQLKRFRKFELFGTGNFNVSLFIDGVLIKQRDLNLDSMRRDRMIFTGRSDRGRSARIRVIGTGELKEIRIEVQNIPLYDRKG